MRRVCGWHTKYFGSSYFMGEVEPLEDKSETHGMCPSCEVLVNAEFEAKYGKEKETR